MNKPEEIDYETGGLNEFYCRGHNECHYKWVEYFNWYEKLSEKATTEFMRSTVIAMWCIIVILIVIFFRI